METQRTFKVIICGAGVGGLALAAFISRNAQVEVVVYESKPEVSAAGEAIAIWKRSWQVFQDMGLDEELAKRNFPTPKEGEVRGPIYRKSDQKEDGYDFHSHLMPYGPLSIPRPKLLEMLQAKLGPNCRVLTSKRAIDFVVENKSAQVSVMFSDGTRDAADIVIGADGVHSTTRKWFFTDLANQQTDPVKAEAYLRLVPPKWSGTYAYRCNVPAEALQAKFPDHRALTNPYIWCGQDKHVVSYPFGAVVHFICYHSPPGETLDSVGDAHVVDVPKQHVIDAFVDWEPEVCVMLELMNPKVSRWTIFVVEGLPLSVSGRVALMGDSAHAMTPHQGVGGGQAIEDAHLLGRLLAHPKTTKDNLPAVLQIYQDIRLPFAQKKAERSRLNGLMYEFNHPDFRVNSKSSRVEMEALGKAVGETFGWLAKGGCDDDWMEAEERLNKLVA
ncbi:FAD/NAD(P)-binding domain superfamily protein [Pleurotus pulmonarius]